MYRSVELIAEIKKKPGLWNSAYKHCADKDYRDTQWLEVANVLFPDWETLTLVERNEKLFEIKRRWKNIRDYYRKENKRWKGKRYMYKDLLKFLDDNEESLRTCSETIVKEEISLGPSGQVTNTSMEVVEQEASPSVSQFQCQSLFGTQEESTCGEAVPSTLKRKLEDDENIDEDKSFLLSLLPEIRKLDGRQKMDFKISVMNGLRMARYSEPCLDVKEEHG